MFPRNLFLLLATRQTLLSWRLAPPAATTPHETYSLGVLLCWFALVLPHGPQRLLFSGPRNTRAAHVAAELCDGSTFTSLLLVSAVPFSDSFCRSMGCVSWTCSVSYGSQHCFPIWVLCSSYFFCRFLPFHCILSLFPIFHDVCSHPFPPPDLRRESCTWPVTVHCFRPKKEHHASCCGWPLVIGLFDMLEIRCPLTCLVTKGQQHSWTGVCSTPVDLLQLVAVLLWSYSFDLPLPFSCYLELCVLPTVLACFLVLPVIALARPQLCFVLCMERASFLKSLTTCSHPFQTMEAKKPVFCERLRKSDIAANQLYEREKAVMFTHLKFTSHMWHRPATRRTNVCHPFRAQMCEIWMTDSRTCSCEPSSRKKKYRTTPFQKTASGPPSSRWMVKASITAGSTLEDEIFRWYCRGRTRQTFESNERLWKTGMVNTPSVLVHLTSRTRPGPSPRRDQCRAPVSDVLRNIGTMQCVPPKMCSLVVTSHLSGAPWNSNANAICFSFVTEGRGCAESPPNSWRSFSRKKLEEGKEGKMTKPSDDTVYLRRDIMEALKRSDEKWKVTQEMLMKKWKASQE